MRRSGTADEEVSDACSDPMDTAKSSLELSTLCHFVFISLLKVLQAS